MVKEPFSLLETAPYPFHDCVNAQSDGATHHA